jgi:hypothetical protein
MEKKEKEFKVTKKKELEDIIKNNRKEAFWDFFDFLNEFFLLLPGAIASLAILFFVFILPLLLWLGILK